MENEAMEITSIKPDKDDRNSYGLEIKMKASNEISVANIYHCIVIIFEWTKNTNRLDDQLIFEILTGVKVNDLDFLDFDMVKKDNEVGLELKMMPGQVSNGSVLLAIINILQWETKVNKIKVEDVMINLLAHSAVRDHYYKPIL